MWTNRRCEWIEIETYGYVSVFLFRSASVFFYALSLMARIPKHQRIIETRSVYSYLLWLWLLLLFVGTESSRQIVSARTSQLVFWLCLSCVFVTHENKQPATHAIYIHDRSKIDTDDRLKCFQSKLLFVSYVGKLPCSCTISI